MTVAPEFEVPAFGLACGLLEPRGEKGRRDLSTWCHPVAVVAYKHRGCTYANVLTVFTPIESLGVDCHDALISPKVHCELRAAIRLIQMPRNGQEESEILRTDQEVFG